VITLVMKSPTKTRASKRVRAEPPPTTTLTTLVVDRKTRSQPPKIEAVAEPPADVKHSKFECSKCGKPFGTRRTLDAHDKECVTVDETMETTAVTNDDVDVTDEPKS